ncbi:PREDICTED: translation initiation factor IF-2-like [Thamnophis sirtalis]|uniref:Translation initiation factor IF-2-like n=1 Tax=Thamnophis sirtalis TaxID=35019 RepID=A0A6I9YWX9_9SAUR|nr:PREDICTED: translation initiation factor IF-2-like [Thamnophis sirtalis]
MNSPKYRLGRTRELEKTILLEETMVKVTAEGKAWKKWETLVEKKLDRLVGSKTWQRRQSGGQSACAHLPRLTPALSPPNQPFPTARLPSTPCRYLIIYRSRVSSSQSRPGRRGDGWAIASAKRTIPVPPAPAPPPPAAAALTAAASLESPPSRGERRGRGKETCPPGFFSLSHARCITAQRGERPIPGQPTEFSFTQRSRPSSK